MWRGGKLVTMQVGVCVWKWVVMVDWFSMYVCVEVKVCWVDVSEGRLSLVIMLKNWGKLEEIFLVKCLSVNRR